VTVYWFHSSIGRPLIELLGALLPRGDEEWPSDLPKHRIEHFDHHGAEDETEWLQEIEPTDCVVVLCLKKRHPVLELFKDTRLRFVNLPHTYAEMNLFNQAHFLTGVWTEIVAKTHRAKAGRGFKVAPNGRKLEEL
jgi:hypothetical protein